VRFRILTAFILTAALFVAAPAPVFAQVDPGGGGGSGTGVRAMGTWNAGTAYRKGDLVSYSGASYLCIVNSPAGTLPTDATKWTKVGVLDASHATTFEVGPMGPHTTLTANCVGGVSPVLKTRYFRVVALDQAYREAARSNEASVVACPQDGVANLNWSRAPGGFGTFLYVASASGGPWMRSPDLQDTTQDSVAVGLSTGMPAPNIDDNFGPSADPPTVGTAWTWFHDFATGVLYLGSQIEVYTAVVRGDLSVNYGTIQGPDSVNWNTAYGWGDHAAAGYMTTPGAWTVPAFNAGDFYANGGMTWTVQAGDVTSYAYSVTGKTMILAWELATTSVGGTLGPSLLLKIPGGYIAQRAIRNVYDVDENGVKRYGLAYVAANDVVVQLFANNVALTWTGTTNTTGMGGQIIIEVK
jgi:hypothetical protein